MKENEVDLSWLPAREEWDFRSVTDEECRLACIWEYARSLPSICQDVEAWCQREWGTELAWYIWQDGPHFPDPWAAVSKGSAPYVGLFNRRLCPGVLVADAQSLKMGLWQGFEIAKKESRDVWTVIDRVLPDESYLLHVDFKRAGTEKIISELTAWVRKEARRFPRPPMAKAAEPPFDCLKWLAAYRLETARKKAGISFETVQAALRHHQRKHPVPDGAPALPIYASHGAWSKAKSDAEKLLKLQEQDPAGFERKVIF